MSTQRNNGLQKHELKLPKLARPSQEKHRRSSTIPNFRDKRSHSDAAVLESTTHVKQQAKLISSWFKVWRPWQQRILLCSVVVSCSKSQLSVLVTSLEPLLHRDFSAFIAPKAAFLKQRSPVHGSLKRFEEEGDRIRDTHRSMSECDVPVCIDNEATCLPDSCTTRLPPLHGVSHQMTANSLQLQSEDFFSFRRKGFGLPLTLEYSTCLLHSPDRAGRQRTVGRIAHKRSKSWTSSTVVKPSTQRLTENFKSQQAKLAKWLNLWDGYQKTWLLLEIVKLCDNEQLGYLSQCIHQRLQEDCHGSDLLTDPLLLNIFSLLDPQSLGRASQVCRRWYRLGSSDVLWKDHCLRLGEREGLERLTDALEALSEGKHVDWKQAYRQLSGVIKRVKGIVIKSASARELEEEDEELPPAPSVSLATLKSTLTLRQMIQMVRDTSGELSSTHNVLQAAPESAMARRRRLRAERQAAALLSSEQQQGGGGGEEEGTGQGRSVVDGCEQQSLGKEPAHVTFVGEQGVPQSLKVVGEKERAAAEDEVRMLPNLSISDKDTITVSGRRKEVYLVPVITDTRPAVPSLPHPEGLRCLVLSGCLADGTTPKPGKVLPIVRVKRLVAHDADINCAMFDLRKVISGSADMTARIHDMRSGHEVRVLDAHKGGVRCLRYSENCLVTGSWDTQCIVWDIVHSSPLAVLSGHTGCVSCLDVTKDYMCVEVTGSYDCTVRVWHASQWHCIHMIHAHQLPVSCVLLEGSLLLSGSRDCSVKVWELETASCVDTLHHPAGVVAMEKSKLLLITATEAGGIHTWDLSDFSPIVCWSLYDCTVAPDTAITTMCLEKSRLLVGASDGCLYEWDVTTGTCVRFLRGHSRAVTSVQCGANRFVTVSADMTICVWYSRQALRDDSEEDDLGDSGPSLFTSVPIRIITI